MIKLLLKLLVLLTSVLICYGSYTYLFGKWMLLGIFSSGIMLGMFLMMFKLGVKNDKLNIYKRELEKESVTSDKNAAKVSVLESKIEVLEKALENALRGN